MHKWLFSEEKNYIISIILLIISSIAFIGMLIGTQLSKRIDGTQLKPIFGWFILIMGLYIITKEIFLK